MSTICIPAQDIQEDFIWECLEVKLERKELPPTRDKSTGATLADAAGDISKTRAR
jgi:hypothetical protein